MSMRQSIVFSAFLVVLLALTSAPALAQGESCYSMEELEAEQAIKIHSELMVIGLTCQNVPGGALLYTKYRQFTQEHKDLLAKYETDLIRFFAEEGAPAPEKSLHTLRTKLANKISMHAAKMQTNLFCHKFSSRLDRANALSEDELRSWAGTVWPTHPTTKPLCQARYKQASIN